MFEFMGKGGPLMYPIMLCSILTVAFGMERAWHYIRASKNGGRTEEIHGLIERGNHAEAEEIARRSPGPVAAVLAAGLRHRTKPLSMIEEEISLCGGRELQRLNRHLHILELIGRIAPLMGLLGTVLGMVAAFQGIAGVRGSVDPSVLASGIWEALITTVAGLCVAIPAMVLHHFFEDRVQGFAHQMKHYGAEAVKHLGEHA